MTTEQGFEDLSPKLVIAYADEEGRFDHVVDATVDAEEQFGDPLGPERLERLGRPAIAGLVQQAREEGVDAWGWLPSEHGLQTMWEDARRRGADLVVLPADLAEPSGLERLRGDRLDEETLSDAPTPVLVVDEEGNRVVA